MRGAFLVGCRVDYQFAALPGACSVSILATRGAGVVHLVKIEALHGDSDGPHLS